MPFRNRLPIAVVLVSCASVVAAALSGAVTPLQGLGFAQEGHWVASPVVNMAFHINGGANTVDARVSLPGLEPGSQVVQGPTKGYVVGGRKIIEFGKSSLRVERSLATPSAEHPVPLEVTGGPYLVYRDAGQLVRLGAAPETMPTGGRVGEPVATSDGTVWLHRTDSGALCRLTKSAKKLDCPATVPGRHAGALSVVGDRPAFVDTTADTITPLSADGLGEPVKLGMDLPTDSHIAAHDAGGRIAVYDGHRRLRLIDAGGPDMRPAHKAVTVDLPDGDYAGPVSSGRSVVMLDRTKHSVLTYDTDGKRRTETRMPADDSGEPRLSRGEDRRVYVDGAEGKHVLVVDHSGSVDDVPVVSPKAKENGRRPGTPDAPRHRGPVEAPTPPDAQQPPEPPVRAAEEPSPNPPQPKPKPEPKPKPNPKPKPDPQPNPEPPPKPRPHPNPEPTQPKPTHPKPTKPKPTTPKPTKPKPTKPKPVPASPPGMPTGIFAALDSDNGNAFVSWTAPNDNGSPITSYTISYWQLDGSVKGTGSVPGNSTLTFGFDIPPGQYQVSVTAVNKAGAGPPGTAYVLTDSGQSDDGDGFRAVPGAYHPDRRVNRNGATRLPVTWVAPQLRVVEIA